MNYYKSGAICKDSSLYFSIQLCRGASAQLHYFYRWHIQQTITTVLLLLSQMWELHSTEDVPVIQKSHWPEKKKGPLDGGGFAIRESLTREINEMITLDKKKKLPGFFSKSYFVEMLVMTHSGHQMCYLVCAVLQVLIHTNYKLFTSLNFRTKLQRMEKASREEE